MSTFVSGGLRLNFEHAGEGAPVILLHGFGMSAAACWVGRGWLSHLADLGFHAVALDSRGHGESEKPTAPAYYAAEAMTNDVLSLINHLDIGSAHIIGHSMGARTAFDLALKHPDCVLSLTGVSIGANLFEQVQTAALIRALEAEDGADAPTAIAETVKTLLSLGNRKDALIACLSAPRPVPRPADLAAINKPVLVACGAGDPLATNPQAVASALPHGLALVIPEREHTDVLSSAVLQQRAVEFLNSA